MNIAFYCKNKNTSKIDCSNLLNGNPGVGGTYYAMLSVAYFLNHRNDSNHKYYVFAESVNNLPMDMNKVFVDTEDDLNSNIKKYDIGILVINKTGATLDSIINKVKETNVKVVIWDHCFIPYFELGRYADYENVVRIVAVGKEQLMTFCDHRAFKKGTYIYNLCNYNLPTPKPFSARKNHVVYIGSIVPLKGLHLLTQAWPSVLKEVPDAQLYIIGSGNLYNQNEKLGKYGIAEYFYEKKLLSPILDANKKIIPSVHFCGVMGNEKFDILDVSKVAVPNPSGLTETFGYTAIEAQLAGCLVTTMKCPGYVDTVLGKDNILYSDEKKLAESVVKLLKQSDYDSSETIKEINTKFSNDKIIRCWELLFDEIENNEVSSIVHLSSNLPLSRLKIKNKTIQNFFSFIPSLMFWEMIIGKVMYLVAKTLDLSTTIHKIYRRKILKK